jgi:hypothetical protein
MTCAKYCDKCARYRSIGRRWCMVVYGGVWWCVFVHGSVWWCNSWLQQNQLNLKQNEDEVSRRHTADLQQTCMWG